VPSGTASAGFCIRLGNSIITEKYSRLTILSSAIDLPKDQKWPQDTPFVGYCDILGPQLIGESRIPQPQKSDQCQSMPEAALSRSEIRPGVIFSVPFLPESLEVLAVVPMGESLKIIGKGLQTGLARDPVLTPDQLSRLAVSSEQLPFDGDARLFRLGVEAHRLGLAYEYDPYFSLSIARVDPLPLQLEAVYDYFLKLPQNWGR